jgi:hypothetical protein
VRLMRRGKSLHRHLGVVSFSSQPSPSSSLLSDLSLPSFSYLTSPLTSPSHLVTHLVSPHLFSSLLISLVPHPLCALSRLSSPLLSPLRLIPSPLRMGTGTPAGANMIHHTHTCIHHTPHRYGDTGCRFVLRCLIVHCGSDTTCILPQCLHILIAPAAQQ